MTPEQEGGARAVRLLMRLATENTGWRGYFRRWYYDHEALRHDATELLHSGGMRPEIIMQLIGEELPPGTQLLPPVSRRGYT
jgi:hypothetical protein